ncbi:MAG TPA: 50S ribosomal protein L21 [Candidatus Methylacidiphilales bacterium]|nr:50S ribosomal protein L21 [Candidatus Methylacidiphilales bacterium]
MGAPTVSGASVTVEILDNVKARKVVAYKYRRREGYHRTVGHRQKLTRVKVSKIAA